MAALLWCAREINAFPLMVSLSNHERSFHKLRTSMC